MIDQVAAELASAMPLTIREASFRDPVLSLRGEGWALSASCAWRVVKSGVLVFGWSHPEAHERIRDLIGKSIVGVSVQSSLMRGDPTFELLTGERVEVFSDHPVDPWVLRTPGITCVGSPSDPKYTS